MIVSHTIWALQLRIYFYHSPQPPSNSARVQLLSRTCRHHFKMSPFQNEMAALERFWSLMKNILPHFDSSSGFTLERLRQPFWRRMACDISSDCNSTTFWNRNQHLYFQFIAFLMTYMISLIIDMYLLQITLINIDLPFDDCYSKIQSTTSAICYAIATVAPFRDIIYSYLLPQLQLK